MSTTACSNNGYNVYNPIMVWVPPDSHAHITKS